MDKIKKICKIYQKVFMIIFQIKVVVKNLKKMIINIIYQDQIELKLLILEVLHLTKNIIAPSLTQGLFNHF